MANTDDSKPQCAKPDLSDDELASVSESIRSIVPEKLPENWNELSLLHQNVSDAIAFLDNEVAALKSREKLHNTFEKTLKSTGYEPLIHMPDIEADEPAQRNPVRWDWIAKFLHGGQRLSLMICCKAIEEDFSRWSSWLVPLTYTDVVDELARQLGIQCPTDMDRDEFRERIVRNYSTAAQVQENRKVVLGMELAVVALKELDDKIVEKFKEAEYVLAGWKSPQQWIKIFCEYGEEMADRSWRRKVADGSIKTLKRDGSHLIAVHKSCLPPAYVRTLTGESH